VPTTEHLIAFDACLARVDKVAHAELKKDEQILWIHDHREREEQEQTKTGLDWTRAVKQQGWDPTSIGWNSTMLKYVGQNQSSVRIADAIYFGHSRDYLALQLADVCCSTVTLHLVESLYPDTLAMRSWRPLVGPFYEIIRNGVMNDGTPPSYREWTKKDEKPGS
jgi:Protein of unknown function (DUF3800)